MPENSWEPGRIIEERYNFALRNLFNHFEEIVKALSVTDAADILALLRTYTQTKEFASYTQAAASRMITSLAVENAKTWREAAQKSMQGRMIYEAVQKEMSGHVGWKVKGLIEENAKLISTFPDTISKQVNSFISSEALKGRRSEFIAKDLMKQFPNVTKARIQLIARTETAKAASAIVRTRSENLKLYWYIWRTSHDERVRPSHKLMNKVLIAWNDPPAPEQLLGMKNAPNAYHAGNIYNCRCYSEPLLNLDQIQWPFRVFHNGKINMLTRADFIYMAKGDLSKAA